MGSASSRLFGHGIRAWASQPPAALRGGQRVVDELLRGKPPLPLSGVLASELGVLCTTSKLLLRQLRCVESVVLHCCLSTDLGLELHRPVQVDSSSLAIGQRARRRAATPSQRSTCCMTEATAYNTPRPDFARAYDLDEAVTANE